ncbi:MAG: hypothetical protein KC503_05180 [Myxococcales bacterium]|nr:hypothetical protein [Myxococcales bacterium]
MTNRPESRDDSTLFRLDDLVAIAKTPTSPSTPIQNTRSHDLLASLDLDAAPSLLPRADLTPAPAVLAPAAPRRFNPRLAALVGGFSVMVVTTVALAAVAVVTHGEGPAELVWPVAQRGGEVGLRVFVPLKKDKREARVVVVPSMGEAVSAPKSRTKTKAKAKAKAKTKAKAKAKTKAKTETKVAVAAKPKGELERLIDGMDGPKKREVAKAASGLPKTLERRQIQHVMRGQVFGAVSRCYERYHVPGFVFTKITISPSGTARARVTGRFARTPTGTCVSDAVRKASFPQFSGVPISVSYPFRLR